MPAKNLHDRRAAAAARSQIERKNQERITRVNAEIEMSLLSEAVASRPGAAARARRPAATSRVGFGAGVEEQAKAFKQLQLLLILAIVLVYAVMASQYESLRDPFIIMFSVPLAAIGVVAALMLTGTPFSLQAYIGVIMLAGIVVSATPSCSWTTRTSCAGATACRCARRSRRPDAPGCGRSS